MRAAVLGSGSWGTTFGKVLADAGTSAVLWARRPEVAAAVRDRHENPDYLPGVVLPAGLTATDDCGEALDGADLVVLAMPSQTLRTNLATMPIRSDALVVSLAKGIELGTTKRMSEVVAEVLGVDAVVVSGPNLAREIAAGQPTATVVAAADHDRAAAVQAAVTTAYFRPYTNTDVDRRRARRCGEERDRAGRAASPREWVLGDNTIARPRSSPAGWSRPPGSASRSVPNPPPSPAWPGWATWWPPAPRRCPGTARFGVHLGQWDAASPRSITDHQPARPKGVKSSCGSILANWPDAHGVDMPITHAVVQVVVDGMTPPAMVASLMGRGVRPE